MNKTRRFLLTTTWIIFSRAYDAYCTSIYTPDLSSEANPLVSVLGFDWTALLTVIGLLMVYAIYTYYQRTFDPVDLRPTESGYSQGEFAAYTYLGKRAHWSAMFYQLPKNLTRFNQYTGLYLSAALVYAGVVSTIMWLLINYTDSYMAEYHSAKMIYTILIGGALIMMYVMNKREHSKYLLAHQTLGQ